MQILNFKLSGLHCEACIRLATMKLKKVEGVKEVKIELPSGKSEITAEDSVTIAQLNAALAGSDYTITE